MKTHANISKASTSPLLLIILGLLIAGCATSQGTTLTTDLPKASSTAESTTPAQTAAVPTAAIAEATTTPTPANPTLYIAEPLPQGILSTQDLSNITLSDSPQASLWFGLAEDAPAGEILHTSEWVYALAAPFPTLRDDVSSADLQSLWQGSPASDFTSPSRLYVPDELAASLSAAWGAPSDVTTLTYQSLPEIDTLWDENAWVILPFDALTPRLKVLSIDGFSPLHKGFEPQTYPLSFRFTLVHTQTGEEMADLKSILAAIKPTNREPDKMTTLVMTGVTALVRATAYRMETKGILYPGEQIVDWLTGADITHISNEVSFYENCPFPNPNSRLLFFCSNPAYIKLFEYIGADIIELTGNHNNDSLHMYGVDVVPFSLNLYRERDMLYFGGGEDLADAKSPALITHNGNQLAFIGCNAPGPDFAWATDEHGGAAPCGDYQWMADEIIRLRKEGYLPIATFQYYEDYYHQPESHHIRDFGRIADASPVILNGSQAHLPKGMAFTDSTFIDYGLGNLFFDQMGIIDDYGNQILRTRWEVIQRHTFYNGKHLSTELLTAMLEDYAQPRPMTAAERSTFLDVLFTASDWISR